jgi:hypothetical protein
MKRKKVRDGFESVLGVNHGVERIDVHGGEGGGPLRDPVVLQQGFEVHRVSKIARLNLGKRFEEKIH